MTESQKNELLKIAKSLVGKSYKYGAKQEEAPELFDCSSFVQYVFGKIGITIPRNSLMQAADQKGEAVTIKSDLSNLEIGDLLFSRGIIGRYEDDLFPNRPVYIGHVALYVGNGEVINARGGEYGKVTVQNVKEMSADRRYAVTLVKRF
jgi:cell wall-associated NlpC family hydrolase